MNDIKPNFFIIRGDKVNQLVNKEIKSSPKTQIQVLPLKLKYESVADKLLELPQDTLVYAIGNQVGAGQEILEKIVKYRKYD